MRIRYMVGLAFLLMAVVWWITLAAIALARGRNISKCPYCFSSRIRHARPLRADLLLHYIHVRPYRCEACLKRFYALKRKQAVKSMHAGAG
jgi:hypothetical protein